MNKVGLNAEYFNDEDKAREYLESVRWSDGSVCPHCDNQEGNYELKGKATRKGLHKCKECRKQFTVTVGTVFEKSHIPLHIWLKATYLMCASKKGISAHQLHRMLGVTYKSSWFIAHRLRFAMSQESPKEKLTGRVEIDETYIGGKPRKGSPKSKRGRGTKKIPVMVLVEKDGNAVSRPLERVTSKALKSVIRENVDLDSRIITDDFKSYKGLKKLFLGGHQSINHSKGKYSVDGVDTNTAESFFALLKRGHYGVFHQLSKQHLHRYCDEFSFRWNHRKITDTERAVFALKGIERKRLTYRRINQQKELMC